MAAKKGIPKGIAEAPILDTNEEPLQAAVRCGKCRQINFYNAGTPEPEACAGCGNSPVGNVPEDEVADADGEDADAPVEAAKE